MAEAVVTSAGKMIADLLIQKAIFLYGVSDQVQDILIELRQLRCFLKDADRKQDEHETIRNLVVEIREVAYDAENVIATFVSEVESRKRRGFRNILLRSARIFKEVIARYKVRSEISTIKTKIIRLTASLQSCGVIVMMGSEGPSSTFQRQPQFRRTYSHVVEKDFVGFEDDMKTLVEKVVSEDPRYRVVSICGMGGLGKTTLAKNVYHHHNVRRRRFDAFAWVSISQQWQLKDVLQRILTKLIPEKSKGIVNMIDDQLVKLLYEFQQQKKCLVVLDDIWSVDAWDLISPAFPTLSSGSKIVLTTRNKIVAVHVDPMGFGLHEPNCLTKEESWVLFMKKAFPTIESPDFKIDARMEKLGMEIVEQCAGLPLAIVVLGGLLATKLTLNEWQKVHQNIGSYLKGGKGCGGGQDGRILEVLALSYQDLPYHLKACFLYLGNYPEDSNIEVEKLYHLWMAEGIVSTSEESGEEETMMDVADRYLSELAHRCMVHVELEPEENYSPIEGRRRFKYCRLHDLMRDLCLKKVKEENFLKVIDYRHKNGQMHPSSSSMAASSIGGSISRKLHRLAIYLDDNSEGNLGLLEQEKRTQNIRTALFFYSRNFCFGDQFARFCKDFKLLKVLDFDVPGWHSDRQIGLPKETGNLLLLRYLGLGKCAIKKLPSSIGNLRYLQTLDLQGYSNISLPNVLWKMEGLIHLYLPYFGIFSVEGKLRVDGLSKLETLENFNSDKVDVEGFFKLTNLRRLTGRITSKLEDLAAVSTYLLNNRKLKHASIYVECGDLCTEEALSLLRKLLRCDCLIELHLHGIIGKLPEYHYFCPSLTKLYLFRSRLEEDPMETLKKLPNLRILELENGAFVGKEMVCTAHGFPHLKRLELCMLQYLEEWRVDDGAMPNLSTLIITACKNLKMLPDGVRFVSTLQKLEVGGMPEAFNDRLRVVDDKEGEDFHKVRHVPSIRFNHRPPLPRFVG